MAHHKSADPNQFILPDLGEGVHEAELIKWLVQPGQVVSEHDILAEMNTDKALVEVPSPRAGTIAQLHGSPGEILKVGNVLVTYSTGGMGVEVKPAAPTSRMSSPVASNSTRTPPAAQASPPAHVEDVPARAEDDGTVVGKMTASIGGVNAEPGAVLATPAVRRLARDLGVDLASISGTGIAGRITEKDVRSAGEARPAHAPQQTPPIRNPAAPPLASPAAPAAGHAPRTGAAPAPVVRPTVPTQTGGGGGIKLPPSREVSTPQTSSAPSPRPAPQAVPTGEGTSPTRIPLRGVRRNIAARLRESINQAVHFTVMDEADISALDGLRKKLGAATGEKLSFLPFVASAVCRVLSSAPFASMNATMDERASDPSYEPGILQHRGVHLGIATDTEAGLMVPVIKNAHTLGVLEIARHIASQAEAARSRSIPREQLMGSTFTISNVGSHAGRFATPVINYPEVAILAVGRGRPGPVVRTVNGQQGLFVGNLLPLSLACDHRVVDGATGALALAEIIRLLQDPEELMGPARA